MWEAVLSIQDEMFNLNDVENSEEWRESTEWDKTQWVWYDSTGGGGGGGGDRFTGMMYRHRERG